MPLFYSHTIDENTRLAIWHIAEAEDFFLEKVPVSRQITHWHKRLQHLAGRYLLQYLFPDFPLQLIQVATTRKPYLPEESHHFSISHCGDFAAAIVSTRCRVGIDIEKTVPRMQVLAPKFLSTAEQFLLRENSFSELDLLTIFWSAKETMFKWHSHGGIDFRQHLVLEDLKKRDAESGILHGAFRKFEPVPVLIPFRMFNDLVLTWLAQPGD